MAKLLKKARSGFPVAMSLPPTWLKSYEEFVTKNASQVSQIESALHSISYIIPGRFRESELASESCTRLLLSVFSALMSCSLTSRTMTVHALLLLLSHYHTTLFASPQRPSPHTRYTRFWTLSSRLYAKVALLLRTIQYTELLCEMCAKRYSEKLRWRLIVFLEILKALCRMILMRVTGGRMAVSPPSAEREHQVPAASTDPSNDDENERQEWEMPRTGLHLPPLPPTSSSSNSSIAAFLSTRVISADEIKAANRLVSRLRTAQGQAAELLWIIRPVVYALAMQRLRANKRDWRPWALGVAMELTARGLGRRDLRERGAGRWRSVTTLEKEEWGKRGWGVAWWGLRGAFFEGVSKKWIDGFASRLKGKPLLDMLGTVVEDYAYLWDEYYFSTATM